MEVIQLLAGKPGDGPEKPEVEQLLSCGAWDLPMWKIKWNNLMVTLFPHPTLTHFPKEKDIHKTVCIGQTYSRFLLQTVSRNHSRELRCLHYWDLWKLVWGSRGVSFFFFLPVNLPSLEAMSLASLVSRSNKSWDSGVLLFFRTWWLWLLGISRDPIYLVY